MHCHLLLSYHGLTWVGVLSRTRRVVFSSNKGFPPNLLVTKKIHLIFVYAALMSLRIF